VTALSELSQYAVTYYKVFVNSKTSYTGNIEYGDLLLTLSKFWTMGLCRLKIKELIGLLEASGLTIQEGVEIFRN
jgi:hypothetical protein